ncbi:hypothetical protein GOBAR_AA03234 [Gossypium barbadense]|uniref:Uncharacterized protein n=1 Tax=Gossypium barbadense TaxID=3634 RepID=A0A2P5YP06_GOSBA|nr:hypothetical protein GOBAR_AA03234 [Gossypium barbadense]
MAAKRDNESGFGIDIGDNEGDRKLRPSDFSLSGDVKVEDDEGDRTFPLDALGSRGESAEILPGVEEG